MDDRENAMAEQTPTTDGIAHIKLQQFIKRLRNKICANSGSKKSEINVSKSRI